MRSQTYTATARWFDGVENRPQEVRVRLSRHHLEFMPWPPRPQASSSMPPSEAELAASRPSLPGLRRYTRKGLSVGEWWRGSPTPWHWSIPSTSSASPDSRRSVLPSRRLIA